MNPNTRYDKLGNLIWDWHEDHIIDIWMNFVEGSTANKIIVIAHSAAGWGIVEVINNRWEYVSKNVKWIIFTDAKQGNFDKNYIGKWK